MSGFSPGLLALVALGGAVGSVLRYSVGLWCTAWFGTALPWGTLAVNVIGSGLIGILGGAMLGGLPLPNELRLLVITGFLGGFTTFSAFSLDVGVLWARSPAWGIGYLLATVVLSLGAFALCFTLARRF